MHICINRSKYLISLIHVTWPGFDESMKGILFYLDGREEIKEIQVVWISSIIDMGVS